MVQEVSIEFKRRYYGVFLACLIIYNDIKESILIVVVGGVLWKRVLKILLV